MRYKNVELRQPGIPDSHEYVIESGQNAEIVAWIRVEDTLCNTLETCYPICYLKFSSEGYYIETIGDRYTEYEDMEALNHVAKYSIRIMNLHFDFKTNYD